MLDLLASGVFEAAMLVCFAAAWPVNIWKAYRSETARGTSLTFMAIVAVGYLCGIGNKLLNPENLYVLAFYVFDLLLVTVAMVVYFRNLRLDAERGAGARWE